MREAGGRDRSEHYSSRTTSARRRGDQSSLGVHESACGHLAEVCLLANFRFAPEAAARETYRMRIA
jgi:hypothetical protein